MLLLIAFVMFAALILCWLLIPDGTASPAKVTRETPVESRVAGARA